MELEYTFLSPLCKSLEKVCDETEELFDFEAGNRHTGSYHTAIGSSIDPQPEGLPVDEANAGFPNASYFQTHDDISTDRERVQGPGSSICYRPAFGTIRCGPVEGRCGRIRVRIWTSIFHSWSTVGAPV